MKILIGNLGAECNTFASDKGTFERWAPNGWITGDDIFRMLRGGTSYLSGMIAAGEEEGVEIIPTVSLLNAMPLMTKEARDYTLNVVLDYIRAHKDDLDGICLSLHGAGVAEETDDLEAYTLEKVREIVGDDMPITVTLDLHGNISQEMVELSDGLFGIKKYPHVDQPEADYLAMKTLLRILRGESKPVTVLRQIPLLIPCSVGCTNREPMKSIAEHVAQYAAEHGLIDATLFHGFPYSDVPCAGASIVTVAEERGVAERAAEELARWVWERRADLMPECPTPQEAVDRALEELAKPGEGYVVINETSDNPGAGTPGDGTWLLQEFLRRDLEGTIFAYIPDKEFVLKAHAAGVGGKVSGLLGGKTDNIHGAPVQIDDAEVLCLSNGEGIYVRSRLPVRYGKMARIRVGNVEIVVTEQLSQQSFDDRAFLLTGADINQCRIVGLKSSAHFRSFFEPRAKAIVTTDPPGIQTANFKQLTFQKVRRPIYPLDPDMEY